MQPRKNAMRPRDGLYGQGGNSTIFMICNHNISINIHGVFLVVNKSNERWGFKTLREKGLSNDFKIKQAKVKISCDN